MGGKGAEKPNRKSRDKPNSTDDKNGDEKDEDALRRTAATSTAMEEGSYSVARVTASACKDSIKPKKNQQTLGAEQLKPTRGRGSERKRRSEGRWN
jgi:hypothetical protein